MSLSTVMYNQAAEELFMDGKKAILVDKIFQAYHLTQAQWSALLKEEGGNWLLIGEAALDISLQKTLSEYIRQENIKKWLAGALLRGQMRSRNVNSDLSASGVQQIFIFPNPKAKDILLVGADRLSEQEKSFLRILARGIQAGDEPGSSPSARRFIPGQDFELNNELLLKEIRHRTRNLNLIYQVVRRVSRLTDQKEIAQVTAELIAEFFDLDFSTVLIVDEAEERLISLGMGGNQADPAYLGWRLPMDRGVTGLVFSRGETYLTNDVSQDPYYYSILEWKAGSEMCLPLWDADRVFGLLNLERTAKNSFSEIDRVMFESLAGILAGLMMNARRHQDLKKSVSQLEAARETALDVSSDLDLEVLLKRVVHRARQLTQAKGAALGLVNIDENAVDVLTSETPWYDNANYRIPFHHGATGYIAATGESLLVPDYSAWDNRLRPDISLPITTVVGVPLKLKGNIIGTLVVMDDDPDRQFKAEDLFLLELMAPQVAISIHNAHLFQELEQRIEAQKQAEKSLMRSTRLAAVGEIAAGVAHELNNPLTTITGFVELALQELPEEFPQREELQIVIDEAQRARGVVRRLLDFARQSDNLRSLTDLNQLVEEVVSLTQLSTKVSRINIKINLDEAVPRISADPNQIKQVFLNLIQNAIQAMPDGGELTLETQPNECDGKAGVMIFVKDSGHGISEEDQERIFDPFYTTRPVGSGTGLGLSVSYGIVMDHEGQIDFSSKEGEGSCFSVWLPAADGDGDKNE
ncbi:MAG: GAF domain-containing protein [Anaerolineales bacterium]